MKSERTYYQLIPEKIFNSLDSLHDLLSPLIKGYSPDNLQEVISTISYLIRKDQGPVPLSIAHLNKLVPQGQLYLKNLMELGIVKRSGRFIPGETCYKYEFAPEYRSRFISIKLSNQKLRRRIDQVWNEIRHQDIITTKGRAEQIKYLDQLSIDESYKEYINSHYKNDTDQYNSLLASAMRIEIGDIRHKVDNTSGRFHSNVTNLSKDLRPFLRINNEPLANIDIKNSQPYLSTILLTDPSKVSWMTKNPAFALLLQSLKVSLNEDVKHYISLVISGKLYEYLMIEFSKEGLHLSRSETKQQVLRILFARNRMPKDGVNRKARQIFKSRFPTVHRIFSKIRGAERGDRFQSFSRFAILLQRIESYLILDVILKRIYKELPGTIAITIHDSIMTGVLTDNVEAVEKIMIEEMQNFVGFRPQIKIEGIIKNKEEEKEEIRKKEGKKEGAIFSNHYVITNLVSSN